MTTKEEILAQAGEPVAWKDTCLTTDENDQQHTETVLLGYEGADLLPDGTDLYTADQVIAARKGLEQEVERLKVERDNHQLDINAELRQQLTKMTEIARKEYLSAIDWAGKHQELSEQLAEKDAELINYKRATDLAYKGSEQDTLDKLAAAQAREQQLRKLIENAPVSSGVCCCGDSMDSHQDPMVCGHSPVDQWDWAVFGLLKETPDTTALEALIAKAGEVMRERSATVCDKRSTYYGRASAESQEAKDCAFNIRALPGVTLEDLK